jgi:cell division protein FtsZ
MIEINRNYKQLVPHQVEQVKIKIIGLGGAGSNVLDRIVLDGVDGASLVAINTDVQALTSSVAAEKVQLGRVATRGLGAGGDPEIGVSAAEESITEIKQSIEGAAMVFLLTGLGGGTGSGAAPIIASLAREQGALVVVFATLPFAFEGKRRNAQAAEALDALRETAEVVICFENDKLGDSVSPKAGIHQAFANADLMISQSVRAIAELFQRPGLLHIGFDELATALRNFDSRCLFGYGEAEGDNRAHDALARALKSPLMDKGRMLADAHNVLVNVSGGASMTLHEVQTLMTELGRHISDQTRVLFGTSVDARMGDRMSVTIISSLGGPKPRPAAAPIAAAYVMPEEVLLKPEPEVEATAEVSVEVEPEPVEELLPVEPVAVAAPLARKHPRQPVEKEKPVEPQPEKPAVPRQESLQFEPVTRGRFEKSEPTIVDGQDLDVPTFLRRNVRIK